MDTKKVIALLAGGIALGVAVGVLIAPQAGQDTRKKIVQGSKSMLDDFLNSIQSGVATLQDKVQDRFEAEATNGVSSKA